MFKIVGDGVGAYSTVKLDIFMFHSMSIQQH